MSSEETLCPHLAGPQVGEIGRREVQIASMFLEETVCPHIEGPQFGEVGRNEIQVQAPVNSRATMHTLDREEKTLTSEQLVTVSELIAGLENLCPLEGWNGVHPRRSPLPLWYPRLPLQDITTVLNAPVAAQETLTSKKETKKAQTVELHGHIHDMRGPIWKPRALKIPARSTSSVALVISRSSLLRKGFR